MASKKGKFIVFEGIDGSGKTTQINLLKQKIENTGTKCLETREPSDGPVGVMIRQCLTGRMKMDEAALAALFAADRLDHINNSVNGLKSKIDEGISVISDRFVLSNYAYQSVKAPLEWVMELNRISLDTLRPDCHIYIDVDPEITLDRMQNGRFQTELFENKKRLTEVRKNGTLPYLRPDGKTQVTVEYDENGKAKRLDAVVLSTQHGEEVSQEQIHEDIKKYVFDTVLPADMVDEDTKFFINPTGRFVIGGPNGDSGLTGRKIIVDTYGGYARHGGGAFSGKDCTKVDRSAAYAARYVAKNIVAAGLADKCEIQLSYAIGVARPTSIMVDTFGTGKVSDEKLVEIIREHFDLRPAGIIKMLDLRRPIYKQTAAYGHFGRTDLDLPWERLDKVDMLKAYL